MDREPTERKLLLTLRELAKKYGGDVECVKVKRSLLPWKETIQIVERIDLAEINRRIEEAWKRECQNDFERRWILFP